MRLVLSCLLLLGCGAARTPESARPTLGAPSDPDAALDADDIAADRAALIEALEEAYAGRRFVTDATFHAFLAELDRLDVHTPRELCDALGSRVSRLLDPGIGVSLDDGLEVRCRGPEGTVGGLPRSGSLGGENLAHDDAAPLFVLEEEPGDSPLAVLAVRAFAPRGDPGWAGLDDAIARIAAAPAVVLDLRGAAGHDARPLIPLLVALMGEVPAPLTEVVVSAGEPAGSMRTEAARLGLAEPFDPGALAPFLAPLGPGMPAPPVRDISVLVDDGCGEACELVARILGAHAHAVVTGAVGHRHRLPTGELGVLVLPRSRLRVTVPLRAVVVSDVIGHVTGDRISWYDRHRLGAGELPETVPDYLPGLRTGTRDRARLRARIAGWLAAPLPSCAALPRASSRPGALANRFHFDRGSRLATIYVSLPPDAARAFVSGCRGLTVRNAHALAPAGLDDTAVQVAFDTLDALERAAGADFVRAIEIEDPDPPSDEPDLSVE